MKLKQAILSVMGRDALRAAVDELELDAVDRRSVEDMRGRLSRAHRATPGALIAHLGESEVKEVCGRVGIPAKGRRAALIDTLLGYEGSVRRQAGTTRGGRDVEAEKPTTPRRGRAGPEVEVEGEPTRWMRPEEAKMSEQPTDRPDVQQPREPGRPFEITRTELVWPGKYDERGNLVEPPRVSLPFQVIEVIEEGRTSREALKGTNLSLFGAKSKGPSDEGWRNKLIWGDNLLVEASLLKDFAGKIDLIYIDPPFATGADFRFSAQIGDGHGVSVSKEQSAIEEKAYRDTWGKGIESYLTMMLRRLSLMRDLVADTGSIFVHLDWHVCHGLKLLLDEVFGANAFYNEIVWPRTSPQKTRRGFSQIHDVLLVYSKSDKFKWNTLMRPLTEKHLERHYQRVDDKGRRYDVAELTAPGTRQGPSGRPWRGFDVAAIGRHWGKHPDELDRLDGEGRIYWPPKGGFPRLIRYLEEVTGTPIGDVWDDIPPLNMVARERTDYPTQKPEALVARVIEATTDVGDIVADFFCGSGTTVAAAEKLDRRWIGCDLGRYSVHTTRKRLLEIRVEAGESSEERGCRPFEVLNLGRYERKYWQGITFGNEPKSDEETALAAYVKFILDLYKAQPIQGFHVHGKKGGALVHVGAVDAPVTISQIEDASAEAQRLGGKELHILGWEFEMGLHDPITQYVRAQHGVIVRLVSIPRETMERRAVEAGDVQFFDLAFLEVEVKPETGGKKERAIKVVLKDFVIPSTDLIPEEVRAKIKKWSDYIDYWAVDWDFRNDTFVNQWQTYRTRQDRSLALETPAHAYDKPGTYQVLVKVVDIFGNDTSHLVKWEAR